MKGQGLVPGTHPNPRSLVCPALQVGLVVKNPSANAGDIRDVGSIPGLGRSPGEGHGNLLQYSCLENPMDRGALRMTVHGVAKSWTWLERLGTHALTLCPDLCIKTHLCFLFCSKLAASMSLSPPAVTSLIPQASLSLQEGLSAAVLCPHAKPPPFSQMVMVGTLKEFAGITQCDHGWRDHSDCWHPLGSQLVPLLATLQPCANAPWIEFCSLLGPGSRRMTQGGSSAWFLWVERYVSQHVHRNHTIGEIPGGPEKGSHFTHWWSKLGVIHSSAAILLTTTSKATTPIIQTVTSWLSVSHAHACVSSLSRIRLFTTPWL